MDVFNAFLGPGNMLIDIKIVSLLCIEPKIWPYLILHGGHLEIQDGRHLYIQITCVLVFFDLLWYYTALRQVSHFYHNLNDFHKNRFLPPVLKLPIIILLLILITITLYILH